MSALPFELDPNIFTVLAHGRLANEYEVEQEQYQLLAEGKGEAGRAAYRAEMERRQKAVTALFEVIEDVFVSSSLKNLIFRHIPSGRTFRFDYYRDSWGEVDAIDLDESDLTELFPVEKTIIVYEEKK